MTSKQIRGDFAKGPDDETAPDKRLRYEQWIIETHTQALTRLKVTRFTDPEYEAIQAQSYHWEHINERPKTGSKILSVKARCWQCVGSEVDAAANKATIAHCSARNCALWSVRPFQPKEDKIPTLPIKEVVRVGFGNFDYVAKALAHPGNRSQAVKGYCHDCKGGGTSHKTRNAVYDCADANCALWYCRGKKSP